MAGRINVDFGCIHTRSNCMNSTICESMNEENINRYMNIIESYIRNRDEGIDKGQNVDLSLKYYMESISNVSAASSNYRDPLYLMQEFNRIGEPNHSDFVLREYTSKVLPFVQNFDYIKEYVSRYNLTEQQIKSVIETASKLNIADRILTNHKNISKRFNITNEISKVEYKPLKYVVESCCSMIDTYNINDYAKMNLCIEEMCYVLGDRNYEYSKKELVNSVLEYLLLRQDALTDRDIKGFRTVLSENCFLTEEDASESKYLLDDSADTSIDSIKKNVKAFMVSRNKTMESLRDTVLMCMNTSIDDIKYNINVLLWLIWDVFRFNMFNYGDMIKEIPKWLDFIVEKLEDDISSEIVSKKELGSIMSRVIEFKSILVCGDIEDEDKYRTFSIFRGMIETLIDKIDNLQTIVYYESNIVSIESANSDSGEISTAVSFKPKFHNMVKLSVALENSLSSIDQLARSDKYRGKISRYPLNFNKHNLLDFIGEDNRADICVAQYILDESDKEMMSVIEQTANAVCCAQKIDCDSTKCFYTILPGLLEFHIKDSTVIETTNVGSDSVLCTENELDCYVSNLALSETYATMLEGFDIDKIFSNMYLEEGLTIENFDIALEALSLLGVEKETVTRFGEMFANYRYCKSINESADDTAFSYESLKIDKMVESWNPVNNVSIDIQIEAAQILQAVLEAAPKAPNIKKPDIKKPNVNTKTTTKTDEKPKDDPNTKVDESRKNPFKGINLNSMKLYLEGLKAKAKDMSQKEKELSRNIDNTFRYLVKSMKDALISDRREAIIKGSVIPSFSKCIKICIALAGVGMVTGNPVVPLMMAIGGFATSKRLTQKERILLLDEIETELEVVEKEIQLAESANKLKKYRALLQYKKDLQRQYQRIRYNVRVGKDLLPNSSTGVKSFDK